MVHVHASDMIPGFAVVAPHRILSLLDGLPADEPISKEVTGMESKVIYMMLEVNIAFNRLYLNDVVNKTCIIARPLPAGLH